MCKVSLFCCFLSLKQPFLPDFFNFSLWIARDFGSVIHFLPLDIVHLAQFSGEKHSSTAHDLGCRPMYGIVRRGGLRHIRPKRNLNGSMCINRPLRGGRNISKRVDVHQSSPTILRSVLCAGIPVMYSRHAHGTACRNIFHPGTLPPPALPWGTYPAPAAPSPAAPAAAPHNR